MLGSAVSEMVRLISCEIIFQEFQPIYDHDMSIPQRYSLIDGQTVGGTTCYPCYDWQYRDAARTVFEVRTNMVKLDCNFGHRESTCYMW